jgi:hypothetical protein
MPFDPAPFVHDNWFTWLNGMPRAEYQTLHHRLGPEETRVMILWMTREPFMQNMSPEDRANALTPEEREAVERLWQKVKPSDAI